MKKFISALLCAVMLPLNVMANEGNSKITFFVDNNVEAAGDGSAASPFKTLEDAKEAIRDLNSKNAYPEGGVDVIIREGTYAISEAVMFTAEDSGKEGAPVRYRAYPQEKVSFVGGTEVTLGDLEQSDNSEIPKELKGKIYSYNLKDNNVEPYNKLYCTGHSQWDMHATFPDDIDESPLATPEVFYNDEITTIARYPNGDEYIKVGTVVNPGVAVARIADKSTIPPLSEIDTMIFKVDVSKERLENWKNAEDGWMFGYWRYDWSDQTTPIREINTDEMTVQSEWPSAFGLIEGQRYYVYNMFCELDAPGEWFYDKNTGEFYIYPLDNNKDSKILLGFSSNNIFEFNECSNIEFENIDIAATRRNGIVINNCEDIKIFGSTIKNISGTGISINGGKRVTVDSCHIYNVGGRGVYLYSGNPTTLERGDCLITNNWIHNFGRLNKTYYGGFTISGVGNTARFNTLYDGPHLGIQFDGNDLLIEYNDISNVLQEAADMGAIYGGRSMVKRGNVFRGNVIHDIKSDSDHGGQYGIYLDDCLSGQIITGNLFYNIEGEAVFVNGGRDCEVTGNTFVNTTNGISFSDIGIADTIDYLPNLGIEPNGLHTTKPYEKYPNLTNLLEDDNPVAPKFNLLKDNIHCNVDNAFRFQYLSGKVTEPMFREWSELNDGVKVGMKDFADPENENYNITKDKVAALPDYEEVDFNKAGLITARLKNTLSDNAVVVAIGKSQAYVNWKRKLIDKDNLSVTPKIKDNLTYVPVRFLAEMLGGKVEFDNGKIIISYNGKDLELHNQSDIAYINGKEEKLAGACFIENSRTLVPLRSCSNLFDKKVFWDDRGLIVVSDVAPVLDDDMIENLIDRL